MKPIHVREKPRRQWQAMQWDGSPRSTASIVTWVSALGYDTAIHDDAPDRWSLSIIRTASGLHRIARPGHWVLCTVNDCVVMTDGEFIRDYE